MKSNVIEVTTCICGDLMKVEPLQKGQLPICIDCAGDSEATLKRKIAIYNNKKGNSI